jgi:hypothetical protein
MIGFGFNREQQKQFAESDIINSELKSAFGDSWRADEHPVLAVGLLQFLWHRPTRNVHMTRMFQVYMPNQEGCIHVVYKHTNMLRILNLKNMSLLRAFTQHSFIQHSARLLPQ